LSKHVSEIAKQRCKLALVIADEYRGEHFNFSEYLMQGNSQMLWSAVTPILDDLKDLDGGSHVVMADISEAAVYDALVILVESVQWRLRVGGTIPSDGPELRESLVDYLEYSDTQPVLEDILGTFTKL